MLELKNVSLSVKDENEKDKEILNNVSLTIDDEKFIAITGPNGGGKSTLAKLIVGIYEPTEGQILFDGQDITFYAEGKELARATNHMEDMGGFMDDAIYIGEQISYSIEGPLIVHVTPGVNFVVGKVLLYDDMPTFSATVTYDPEKQKISLGEFKVDE